MKPSWTAVTSAGAVPSGTGQVTWLFWGMIQSNPLPRSRTDPPGAGGSGSVPDNVSDGGAETVPVGLNAGSLAEPSPGSAAAGAEPSAGTTTSPVPVLTTSHVPLGLHVARPTAPVTSAPPTSLTRSSPPTRDAMRPSSARAGNEAPPGTTVSRPVPSAFTRSTLPPPTSSVEPSSHTGAEPDGPSVGSVPSSLANHTLPPCCTASLVPSGDTDGHEPSTSEPPPASRTVPPAT